MGSWGSSNQEKKMDARIAKESIKKPIEHKKPGTVVLLHGMESFSWFKGEF